MKNRKKEIQLRKYRVSTKWGLQNPNNLVLLSITCQHIRELHYFNIQNNSKIDQN